MSWIDLSYVTCFRTVFKVNITYYCFISIPDFSAEAIYLKKIYIYENKWFVKSVNFPTGLYTLTS